VREKECEGEEEERKEKEGHEAREREFAGGARVGIGIWEAFFVVTGVAPVPLHGLCSASSLHTQTRCCLLLHHFGVGDPFHNHTTTHHATTQVFTQPFFLLFYKNK